MCSADALSPALRRIYKHLLSLHPMEQDLVFARVFLGKHGIASSSSPQETPKLDSYVENKRRISNRKPQLLEDSASLLCHTVNLSSQNLDSHRRASEYTRPNNTSAWSTVQHGLDDRTSRGNSVSTSTGENTPTGNIESRREDHGLIKRGRKTILFDRSDTESRRKAQNRHAQRAFRRRKAEKLEELQKKLATLLRASTRSNVENELLQAQVTDLHTSRLRAKKEIMHWPTGRSHQYPVVDSVLGQPTISSNCSVELGTQNTAYNSVSKTDGPCIEHLAPYGDYSNFNSTSSQMPISHTNSSKAIFGVTQTSSDLHVNDFPGPLEVFESDSFQLVKPHQVYDFPDVTTTETFDVPMFDFGEDDNLGQSSLGWMT